MSAQPQSENPKPASLLSLLGITESLIAESKAREDARAKGLNPGPVTGMLALDDAIGGCLEIGVHLLHGAPGSGKSALALGIGMECGTPAIYVTAELRPQVIGRRLMARHHRLSIREVKRMGSDQIYSLWQQVAVQYPMFGIADARKSEFSVERMRECIEILSHSHGRRRKGLGGLVIVDSLHTWATRTFSDIGEERERLDHAIGQLELLASLADVAVLAVCERNRMGRKDTGQAGMKGTGRLEYAGETVMGMDEILPDEKADRDAIVAPPGCRAFGLHISKNREGEPKTLPMYFNGAHQRHELILEGFHEGSLH